MVLLTARRPPSDQNCRSVLAVPIPRPGVNRVVPKVVSRALAAVPVRVTTIPLIRA